MPDDKYERLRRQNRRILVLISFLFLVIVVLGYLLLTKKTQPQELSIPPLSALKGKDGENGKDGYTPIKGLDYFDGQPGPTGIQGSQGERGPEGAQGLIGPMGATGATGLQGDQGPSGRTPIIRCNTKTGMFESQYQGDDLWSPIEGSSCVAKNP